LHFERFSSSINPIAEGVHIVAYWAGKTLNTAFSDSIAIAAGLADLAWITERSR
jgi:hypothetical protein